VRLSGGSKEIEQDLQGQPRCKDTRRPKCRTISKLGKNNQGAKDEDHVNHDKSCHHSQLTDDSQKPAHQDPNVPSMVPTYYACSKICGFHQLLLLLAANATTVL
jgi:hypothetical protein